MSRLSNRVRKLLNLRPLVSVPVDLEKGDLYCDSSTSKLIYHNGTAAVPVITTTSTDTLTNKTLTSPTLNSPTISSPSGLVKGDVGLGNVDNTSDATKNAASVTLTNKTISAASNTISGLTKSDVGLGNVDNTSDATKNAASVTLTNKTISPASNTISLASAHLLVGSGGGAAADVAVTGDVTISNAGVTAIGTNKVSNSQLAQIATATFKGRTTAGTGNVEDLTATQATALLDAVSSGAKGLAPASGGGTTNYLRADGTWTNPSTGSTDLSVVSKTSGYTAVTSDQLILCSGAAFTIALYTAVGNSGKQITIRKTDSSLTNIITIDGNASETIDGALTTTLNTQYETIRLASDGTNWVVLSRSIPSPWTDGGATTVTGSTTNPTKGSVVVTDKIWWRRNGRNIQVRVDYRHTNNGTNGTGDYLIAAPSGITFDTTFLTLYTTITGAGAFALTGGIIGSGIFGTANTAGNQNVCGVVAYDSTKVRIMGIDVAAAGSLSATYFGWGAAAAFMSFTYEAPVSGWNG